MSATLENKLETAASTLGRQCEPMLADDQVHYRLASLDLNQPASPESEDDDDPAVLDVPYVRLHAKREPTELSRAAGVFDMPLEIEVGDNAQHASDNGYLDRLFRAAGALFFYRTVTDVSVTPNVTLTLFDALAAAVPGLVVLGIKPDSISTDQEVEGSIFKRMITGTFICRQTA